MFNERDQRCTTIQPCSLPIQVMTTGPLPAPSKCKSRRFNMPRVMKTKFPATVMVFDVVLGPHYATSHLRSRLESQHQSVPGCAEECGDPLVQSGGRWQTLGVAAGLGVSPQVQRDPGLASEGVLRLCTLLSLAPLLPQPEPAGLLRFVIRPEHDLPQHQSQPDRCHLPSIRRPPTGACRKRHTPSSGSVSRQ